MSLKNILFNTFDKLENVKLPDWLDQTIINGNCIINSNIWKTNKIRRIRFCEINIKNKFIAESLVIYPDFCYETPILGTEYLSYINKKYFATIDFHPLKMDKKYEDMYIQPYLNKFPNRTKEQSKIYDLNKYFSKKLWLTNSNCCFYDEYLIWFEKYLNQYKICLENSKKIISSELYHKGYDQHLSSTDPAYGILKSHYNKDFAEKYIYEFLFDLGNLN